MEKGKFLWTTSILNPLLGAWEGKGSGECSGTGSGTPLQTKISLLQGSPGSRQDTGMSIRCCPNPINPSGLKQQLPHPVISPEHPTGIISALKKKKTVNPSSKHYIPQNPRHPSCSFQTGIPDSKVFFFCPQLISYPRERVRQEASTSCCFPVIGDAPSNFG